MMMLRFDVEFFGGCLVGALLMLLLMVFTGMLK